jgi:hypothetical protein
LIFENSTCYVKFWSTKNNLKDKNKMLRLVIYIF